MKEIDDELRKESTRNIEVGSRLDAEIYIELRRLLYNNLQDNTTDLYMIFLNSLETV